MVWKSGGPDWLVMFVSLAAITAMLGVLLNLVLGLSRVLLAMGRRHDVPAFFGSVNASGTTPIPAVIGVGLLIAGLTLIGDVKTTWTFSAFTVLIYYGITNLAALRLPPKNRLYPRFFSYAGLAGVLLLVLVGPADRLDDRPRVHRARPRLARDGTEAIRRSATAHRGLHPMRV